MSEGKWYPGKYMGLKSSRHSNESSQSSSSSNPSNVRHGSSGSSRNPNIEMDEAPSAETNEALSESMMKIPTIGQLSLTIKELRYLSIAKPRIRVEIENFSKECEHVSEITNENSFSVVVDFREITSDVVILFYDDSSSRSESQRAKVVGRIVIPFAHCLGPTKAKTSKPEWRQIFPTYRYTNKLHDKFVPGLDDIGDSAMTRPAVSLGFVHLKCDIVMLDSQPLLKQYLLDGMVRTKKFVNKDSSIEPRQNYHVLVAKFRRDYRRVQKMLSPPTLISSFLSFPEVFVLIGTFYFVCVSTKGYSLPIVIATITLLNGLITANNRDYSDYMIWNNPVLLTRIANIESGSVQGMNDVPMMRAQDSMDTFEALPEPMKILLKNLFRSMNSTAISLEKLSNMLSFVDVRVSLIAYAIIFAMAFLSSFLILILKWRRFSFISGSLLFIGLAFRSTLSEKDFEVSEVKSDETNPKDFLDKFATFRTKIIQCIRSMENLWYRIPDETELVHRYISSLSIVKEGGGEMKDAEAEFAKKTTSK